MIDGAPRDPLSTVYQTRVSPGVTPTERDLLEWQMQWDDTYTQSIIEEIGPDVAKMYDFTPKHASKRLAAIEEKARQSDRMYQEEDRRQKQYENMYGIQPQDVLQTKPPTQKRTLFQKLKNLNPKP